MICISTLTCTPCLDIVEAYYLFLPMLPTSPTHTYICNLLSSAVRIPLTVIVDRGVLGEIILGSETSRVPMVHCRDLVVKSTMERQSLVSPFSLSFTWLSNPSHAKTKITICDEISSVLVDTYWQLSCSCDNFFSIFCLSRLFSIAPFLLSLNRLPIRGCAPAAFRPPRRYSTNAGRECP